jgi:TolB-like protein/DNA-binding winged helix-turn-helix (wHTH) protein
METQGFYEFGPFRIDPVKRALLRDHVAVSLPPKSFDVLLALVANGGEPLTREELMKRVWPDTFVEEGNLTQAIFLARKALGDNPQEPRYIVTVPRQGYRFSAGVTESGDSGAPAARPATPLVAERVGPHPARLSRRLWTAAGALLLTGAATRSWMFHRNTMPPAQAMNSVAVLPFANMSADPENEYFSDGLTEEITSVLGNVEGLKVAARSTAFQFKGKSGDVRLIGRQLGVGTVLEGSVRKQKDRVRVTVHLNSTADGRQLWSRNYDRELNDLFAVQEEIAQAIVATLRSGSGLAPPKVRPSTSNVAAYNLYLQGRYQRGKLALERAADLFRQAIDKDPGYAVAHAALADCYAHMGRIFMLAPKDAYSKAASSIDKALAIDESLADAHAAQGYLSFYYKWDWAAARRHFERAIALDPDITQAHLYYSRYYLAMGQIPASLAELKRALALDPADPVLTGYLVWHHLCAREYDQAVAAAGRSLAIDPNNLTALVFLRWTYEQMGLLEKAAEVWQRALVDQVNLGRALEAGGPKGYWHTLLTWQLAQKHVSCYHTAEVYTRLGEAQQALRWLDRAFEDRNPWLVNLNVDPIWDPLRSEPRFVALVKKVGLPLSTRSR